MPIPEIAEVRAMVRRLQENLPKEVDVLALGVKSKAPFQLLCTREALAWRTEELARNACDALERSDFAVAGILSRGVTENAALVWKLMDLLNARKNYAPQEMNDHLIRALVGRKDAAEEFPEAYNVLTLVQRMDKAIGNVLNSYGSLSEFAHPNWSGVLGLYGNPDRKKYITTFGRGLRGADNNAVLIASALLGSLIAFHYAYNKISDELPIYLSELEGLEGDEKG